MLPQKVLHRSSIAQGHNRILTRLDSRQTHEHVLAKLEAYAPLTSAGIYCVVFDIIIEHIPADRFPNLLWNQGDIPKTAVREYL